MMVPNRRTSIGGQAFGWPGGNERGGRRLFIVAGAAACGVIGRGDANIRNRLSPIPNHRTPALPMAGPMPSVTKREIGRVVGLTGKVARNRHRPSVDNGLGVPIESA
jgi:hypothetical protein